MLINIEHSAIKKILIRFFHLVDIHVVTLHQNFPSDSVQTQYLPFKYIVPQRNQDHGRRLLHNMKKLAVSQTHSTKSLTFTRKCSNYKYYNKILALSVQLTVQNRSIHPRDV